jgi:hypothetical protein
MRIKYFEKIIKIGFVFLAVMPALVRGQPDKVPCQRQSYHLSSGIYDGPGNSRAKAASVFRTSVQISNATWLRLEFGENNLGKASYMVITSLEDGGKQRLDAKSIKQWYNSSAYFNGDAVDIELFTAPGDKDIYFEMKSAVYNEREPSLPKRQKITADYCESATHHGICGNYDNRESSYDDAVGRLSFIQTDGDTIAYGTAFIASNGTYLSVGHNFVYKDEEPPRFLEFNVPLSDDHGEPVFADPDDQYSVNLSTKVYHPSGDGEDWAVFECYPNSNTELLPVQVQEDFFRLSIDVSDPDEFRVTGYGLDNCRPGDYYPNYYNEDSKTQQTSTGDSGGEFPGWQNNVYWKHYVDIMLGSSGSPLEVSDTHIAVGINASAGCPNIATSFNNIDLEEAINDFPGSDTKYADSDPPSATKNGKVVQPYDTVGDAVTAVSPGCIVSIVTGSYDEDFTINKAVTLEAPVGTVTIGPSLAKLQNQRSNENIEQPSPDEKEAVSDKDIPTEFFLAKNYPNPFNPQTTISYALPKNCYVTLTIYNMLGQEVRNLVNELQSEGYKSVVWDGKDNWGKSVPSGVYVCKMSADKFTQSRRLSLLK